MFRGSNPKNWVLDVDLDFEFFGFSGLGFGFYGFSDVDKSEIQTRIQTRIQTLKSEKSKIYILNPIFFGFEPQFMLISYLTIFKYFTNLS